MSKDTELEPFIWIDEEELETEPEVKPESRPARQRSGKPTVVRKRPTVATKTRAEVVTTDRGRVTVLDGLTVKQRDVLLRSEFGMVVQLLKDGLSYLNYSQAVTDKPMGLGDPKQDYDAGIGFAYDALHELMSIIDITEIPEDAEDAGDAGDDSEEH